jgi:2-methylisocitrate lyase-like PEP mutase family enzyme
MPNPTLTALAQRFLALHRKGSPLLLANAWDTGTARLLASLGFEALATTSWGHAGTLGRRDGCVTRDEALAHAREIAAATPLPVNADLERCFAIAPEGVAETLRLAARTGIAGASVEDSTGEAASPMHPPELATARVEAAALAARAGGFVLTARCENYLHGIRDLKDTIARLQSFEAAGADVLYAPGLSDLREIETVVKSVGAPVNVLCMPNGPTVPELASVGVARISVGSTFYNAAMGALVEAAREWREQGTHGFWQRAIVGANAGRSAFRA